MCVYMYIVVCICVNAVCVLSRSSPSLPPRGLNCLIVVPVERRLAAVGPTSHFLSLPLSSALSLSLALLPTYCILCAAPHWSFRRRNRCAKFKATACREKNLGKLRVYCNTSEICPPPLARMTPKNRAKSP